MAFYPELFGIGECTECNKSFDKSSYTQKVCKSCRSEYKKRKNLERWYAWYKNNKNKALQHSRNWLNKNRDVLRERYRPIRKRNLAIWKANNPDKVKMLRKIDGARRKNAGKLGLKLIQRVYEHNIALYGKLTCILCMNHIEFGQDSLEHKIPVSRGGKNIFENLGISHLICNIKKNTKTVEEYLEIQNV